MKLRAFALFILLFAFKCVGAQPDTVNIGVYLLSIHDIDFHDNEYTARFWLWVTYRNPLFDFKHQLDIPNAKSYDLPDAINDSIDNNAWVMLKMKSTLKENFKVHNFPFDKQHLSIRIENSIFDNKALVFKPDIAGSSYAKDLGVDGWTIKNFRVSTSTNNYDTSFGDSRVKKQFSQFASFNIDLDLERHAFGLFMKIFSGMYIAFLIALISFAPKPEELEPRFGLPVGGLFAAVGNKYIIDSMLPVTPSFSLVDTLHTITFLGIFSILLLSAICLRLHDRGKEEQCKKLNYFGSRIVIFLFLLSNAFFISMAIA
jgi:hypothetical protein